MCDNEVSVLSDRQSIGRVEQMDSWLNSPLGFVSQPRRMEVALGHQHQCSEIRYGILIDLIVLLLPFTLKCFVKQVRLR